MRTVSTMLSIIICFAITAVAADSAELNKAAIGKKVTNFKLKDYRGKQHSLIASGGEKGTIIYFMGTDCPLAKLYGPRLQSISDEFSEVGISVLGINSNVQDSITELDAYARRHSV